eukprot:scaffold220059_cov30-Tisochrysis_lutea.AAC.5
MPSARWRRSTLSGAAMKSSIPCDEGRRARSNGDECLLFRLESRLAARGTENCAKRDQWHEPLDHKVYRRRNTPTPL